MTRWVECLGVVVLTILIANTGVCLIDGNHIQSLEWGFYSGERFDFREIHIIDRLLGDVVNWYLIAPTPPTIKEPLMMNDSTPVVRSHSQYYPDGSEMDYLIPLNLAVPIGNWSLLTEIKEANMIRTNQTGVVFDTPTSWGFNTTEEDLFFNSSVIFHHEFSKVDGVIIREGVGYLDAVTNSTNYDGIERVIPITISYVTIGVTLTGIFIVLIVIYIRRR